MGIKTDTNNKRTKQKAQKLIHIYTPKMFLTKVLTPYSLVMIVFHQMLLGT